LENLLKILSADSSSVADSPLIVDSPLVADSLLVADSPLVAGSALQKASSMLHATSDPSQHGFMGLPCPVPSAHQLFADPVSWLSPPIQAYFRAEAVYCGWKFAK